MCVCVSLSSEDSSPLCDRCRIFIFSHPIFLAFFVKVREDFIFRDLKMWDLVQDLHTGIFNFNSATSGTAFCTLKVILSSAIFSRRLFSSTRKYISCVRVFVEF